MISLAGARRVTEYFPAGLLYKYSGTDLPCTAQLRRIAEDMALLLHYYRQLLRGEQRHSEPIFLASVNSLYRVIAENCTGVLCLGLFSHGSLPQQLLNAELLLTFPVTFKFDPMTLPFEPDLQIVSNGVSVSKSNVI